MPISCTPSDLADKSKCYCFDSKTVNKIIIYLLAVIAELDDVDPNELADAAKCYCFDNRISTQVTNYLLCQIANGGAPSGPCNNLEGSGAPT